MEPRILRPVSVISAAFISKRSHSANTTCIIIIVDKQLFIVKSVAVSESAGNSGVDHACRSFPQVDFSLASDCVSLTVILDTS